MTRSLLLSILMVVVGAACTDRKKESGLAEHPASPAATASSPTSKATLAAIDNSFNQIIKYDFEAAKTILSEANRNSPGNPIILNNLALIVAMQSDLPLANKLLDEALRFADSYQVGMLFFAYAAQIGSSAPLHFIPNLSHSPIPGEGTAPDITHRQALMMPGEGMLVRDSLTLSEHIRENRMILRTGNS